MIRILLSLVLITSLHADINAQDTLVLYYDQQFQKTDDSSASNIAIAVRQDSLWQFSMFVIASQKRILSGYYDHDIKTLTGRCEYFYLSGKRRAMGYFHDGLKVGPWEQWDEKGKQTDSSFYSKGEPKFSYQTIYYENGTIHDFTFVNGSKSGRKVYNDEGILMTAQDFDDKAGIIKEYYQNGQPRVFSEFNKSGKLSKTTYYSENGTEIPETEVRKREAALQKKQLAMTPEYPGGMGSFQSYLLKNSVKTEYDDVQTQLQISFVLNEFGHATEIRVINAPNPTIESSIIKLIQQMTKWDMKGQKSWPVNLTINMR
jgi:hypothetical protein